MPSGQPWPGLSRIGGQVRRRSPERNAFLDDAEVLIGPTESPEIAESKLAALLLQPRFTPLGDVNGMIESGTYRGHGRGNDQADVRTWWSCAE